MLGKTDPKGLVITLDNTKLIAKRERNIWRMIRYRRGGRISNLTVQVAEPPSIGITLIAADKFEVSRTYDYLEEKWKYDDLEALIRIC